MRADQMISEKLAGLIEKGLRKAAEVLNAMLDSHIELSAPRIRLSGADEVPPLLNLGVHCAAVIMRYSGGMRGTVELVFDAEEAGKLVDCLIGEDSVIEEGLDAVRAGTLCEVGNIVINAVLGTIANSLELHLEYTVPRFMEGTASMLVQEADLQGGRVVLIAETAFMVATKSIRGKIVVFFSQDAFERLSEA